MQAVNQEIFLGIVRLSQPVLAECVRHGLIRHDQNGTLRFELKNGRVRVIKLEETIVDERNYTRNGDKNNGA